MSRGMTKPTKWHEQPMKTHIGLSIRPVRSESLVCALWLAKDQRFLQVDSEVSDQTGWLPRLIRVFPGAHVIWLVLLCCGSNVMDIRCILRYSLTTVRGNLLSLVNRETDYKNLSWMLGADRKNGPRVTVWQWSRGTEFYIRTKQQW